MYSVVAASTIARAIRRAIYRDPEGTENPASLLAFALFIVQQGATLSVDSL
jgi:hypothetical protein